MIFILINSKEKGGNFMKYEKPEVQIFEFATDIVQTSGPMPTRITDPT